jgi:hypothetical protein
MAAAAATPVPGRTDVLSDVAERGELDASLLLRLADFVHARHSAAEPVAGPGAERIRPHLADPQSAEGAAQAAEFARHARTLDSRAAAGRVRRMRGDLRLENLALTVGQFELVTTDGADAPLDGLLDLAGLLVDLLSRRMRAEANLIANRYADVFPQGAAGWSLLPLFLSLRASAASAAALRPCPARLVAIGGLSGTGKTTVARLLAGLIGHAPGARVLRSDVFRKRIAGLPPEARLPASSYTRHSDEATFEALFESAEDHLSCGTTIILDAVFMSRSEREVAQILADRARVPFSGIWLEAPERDRVARVAARTGDASDADVDVVREQSRHAIGDLGGWHRMRVNRPLDLIVPAARAFLDRPHGSQPWR